LSDTAEDFTKFDLEFHIFCTRLSGNPVFTLIFNGFGDLYTAAGILYFTLPASRTSSRKYYKSLVDAVTANDLDRVEGIVRSVMQESIDLWQKAESLK
jgi:GntR family negative regulator for fad regulon and positive regulator of fabA